ncbi:MAG: hypothetical protein ACTS10_19270 [Kiloniellales bacterium]
MNGVSVSPSQVTVGPNGGSVSLTWRVNRSQPRDPFGSTVPVPDTTRSTEVRITLGGQTLLSQPRLLARTTSIPPDSSETLVFRETLPLPPSVARALAQGSGQSALIIRTFQDSGAAATQTARLSPGGGQALLAVQRIDLQFETGSRTQVVALDGGLRAVADVRFSGSGLLQAEWQVSVADGLRGSGRFRTLSLVRRPLLSSGTGRLRLFSPPLPTEAAGLYEVALVVTEPDSLTERSAIRYFVTPNSLPPVADIDLLSPADGSGLTESTLFSWRGLPNAAAYQIEVFADDGVPPGETPQVPLLLDGSPSATGPLSGRVVSGTETQTRLSQLSLRHLPLGQDYRWRLRALGSSGEVIGISPFRRLSRQ